MLAGFGQCFPAALHSVQSQISKLGVNIHNDQMLRVC
jgi:hypothetical protein